MTDKDVKEIFGKSIWEMTCQEIIENGLEDVWVHLVDNES